ncbi:MAG: penicillin-binding transpeptidase domain-containing protein, partial [Candidatus Mucispirillum faecigallinarum]|nr:penicillin-binding transpeptidase domain-containing protein [Candidatus Mucispirillum faecigallinarum]
MLFAALKDDLLGYYRRRIILFFAIFVIISSILFARLFILQVIQYEQLSVDANRNRIKTREIIAERGFIYDSKMNLLVSNTPSYDLVLNKDEIRRGDDVIGMLKRVQEVVDFDMDKVIKDYKDRRIPSVLISRGLSLSDIAYFEEYSDNFAGLSVELHSVRKYSDGLSFSHILGYVSEATPEDIEKNKEIYKRGSYIGTMGVELQYENELRGSPGSMEIERDARGRIVNILKENPAVAGNDVVLTIDSELQQYAAETMEDKKGAVVILDISDNSLLTLYSAPSYDLNMFTPYLNETEWERIHKDKRSPLINRPIEGQYSPGSVYKVAMALAGYEEKAVTPETTYKCIGTFRLNSYFSYRCWKRSGHGKVNMQEALAQSCDI